MSLTATSIKLVQFGSFPSMFICYEEGQLKWVIRARKDVPGCLWPPKRPEPGTLTAKLMSGEFSQETMGDIRSDKWFEHPQADRYYVRESCFRNGPDSVVALLWWEDEKQIIDLQEEEERNAARRSDGRWGDDEC